MGESRYLALIAEIDRDDGRSEDGLCRLSEALTVVNSRKEGFYTAEIHRLKGELLLQQSPDNHTEAVTCFHKALNVAQSQQAKSLELRAATSHARLLRNQGKRDEARELPGNVYGWFTEGHDTADLKDAKALLDDLEGRHEWTSTR